MAHWPQQVVPRAGRPQCILGDARVVSDQRHPARVLQPRHEPDELLEVSAAGSHRQDTSRWPSIVGGGTGGALPAHSITRCASRCLDGRTAVRLRSATTAAVRAISARSTPTDQFCT